jgi:2-polyprenyl-6-hydroxyphenyl methylase/3-demethylubiquinone-9 3-methyltransferase
MIYPMNYLPAYHPAANANARWNRRHLKKLKKRLGLEKIKVLDVGCGLAYFLLDSTSRDKGVEGYGLDVKNEVIKFAKKISEKNKLGIKFYVGNAEKTPFEDSSFHLVVCNHVIEHVKKPENIIKECHRVLKKGGELWLGTPSKKGSIVPSLPPVLGLEVEPEDHVVEGFEQNEIRALVEKWGFEAAGLDYVAQFFGKCISDVSGMLGEMHKVSMKNMSKMEPLFADSAREKMMFDLKVMLSTMLSYAYSFDSIFKGSRGKELVSRWIKT